MGTQSSGGREIPAKELILKKFFCNVLNPVSVHYDSKTNSDRFTCSSHDSQIFEPKRDCSQY